MVAYVYVFAKKKQNPTQSLQPDNGACNDRLSGTDKPSEFA
jgi:hypothetical protein